MIEKVEYRNGLLKIWIEDREPVTVWLKTGQTVKSLIHQLMSVTMKLFDEYMVTK